VRSVPFYGSNCQHNDCKTLWNCLTSSNIDQVVARLTQWVGGFIFRQVGIHHSLGRDIRNEIAKRVQDRSIAQQRGVTGQWPPNAPKEGVWKGRV
jgi:hypothetical protein